MTDRFAIPGNDNVALVNARLGRWALGLNFHHHDAFPRGTDLSHFSQDYLNGIARRFNQRARKTLGFETPADRLRAALH